MLRLAAAVVDPSMHRPAAAAAASPRYSPLRHQQHHQHGILSMPLLRLLKYAAAALGLYALGYRHGAGQTPTVPAAAASMGGGGGGGAAALQGMCWGRMGAGDGVECGGGWR